MKLQNDLDLKVRIEFLLQVYQSEFWKIFHLNQIVLRADSKNQSNLFF